MNEQEERIMTEQNVDLSYTNSWRRVVLSDDTCGMLMHTRNQFGLIGIIRNLFPEKTVFCINPIAVLYAHEDDFRLETTKELENGEIGLWYEQDGQDKCLFDGEYRWKAQGTVKFHNDDTGNNDYYVFAEERYTEDDVILFICRYVGNVSLTSDEHYDIVEDISIHRREYEGKILRNMLDHDTHLRK